METNRTDESRSPLSTSRDGSALSELSAKWRKEAEELDLLGTDRRLHPYERAGYRGGAGRICRMADELDGVNQPVKRKENSHGASKA